VGYDGSEESKRALVRAAEAAGERATVVIVTATPQVYSGGPAPEPLVEPGDDPSRRLADAKATVSAHAAGARVVAVARTGDPADELLDVSRDVGADLIVIGRRGTDCVARTLLGSVTVRLVGHAACDVVVVA
jgi:nucleotide-binding universal stress UspA family protein